MDNVVDMRTERIRKETECNRKQKKELKRTVGYMAWGLVIYTIISNIIAIVGILIYIILKNIVILLNTPNWRALSSEEVSGMFSDYVEEGIYGILSCIIVVVGVCFLCLYFRKRVDRRQMFAIRQKMELKTFLKIFCVFMGVQLVIEPIFAGMESLFNLFGYSVLTSLEEASMDCTSTSMVLYAVLLGPIAEELVYRGFVLTSLKKYGKIFSIIISSMLFGVMHENLPQSIFAFGVGLVLGYVAMEYSIGWAILLHIMNNGMSELMYYLFEDFSEGVQCGIYYGVYGVLFLLGMFFLWKNRKKLQQYRMQNKPNQRKLMYAFTTVGMVVFVLMETISAFSMIEKIG